MQIKAEQIIILVKVIVHLYKKFILGNFTMALAERIDVFYGY